MKDSQVLMMRIPVYFQFALLLACLSIMAGCGVRNVPFALEKIGLTATIVAWETGAG